MGTCYSSPAKMYDVMSITKAVIGLLCDSTREDLLNMTGYSEKWDYDDFRRHVERGDDLKAYANRHMAKDVKGFAYCNLAYQILASEHPDIAKRFGEFIGRPVTHVTPTWVSGDGWKWEHSRGQPLGPHGLYMSKEVGHLFGAKARPLLQGAKGVPILKGRWGGCGKDDMKRYWHGWFFKNDTAYAIGYVSQIIAVRLPRGQKPGKNVAVHFYTENWSKLNTSGCEFVHITF